MTIGNGGCLNMEFEEYIVDLNADCLCGCMEGDRFHKIFHFPNDYGASVVANPKKAGFAKKGYRVLLLRFSGRGPNDYSVVTAPVFDSGILECETWEQTAETLKKIKGL
ncbi:MAG: hypothetical protein FWF40_00420 [Methanomassiliicoccaceae archaeon]|nr:hypothetical protein [Methanomassiliicoccaceae archaeon]